MSVHASATMLVQSRSFPLWTDYPSNDRENTVTMKEESYPTGHRTLSCNSGNSFGSTTTRPLRVRNENVVVSRTISLATLALIEGSTNVSAPRQDVRRASHKSSWGTDIPVPPQPGYLSIEDPTIETMEDVDLSENPDNGNDLGKIDETADPNGGLTQDAKLANTKNGGSVPLRQGSEIKSDSPVNIDPRSHPFRRWMSTLRRKSSKRRRQVSGREDHWSVDDSNEITATDMSRPEQLPTRKHKKSSSRSSSGFVTAIKSASMSLATSSIAPQSRKARRSTLLRSSKRSSFNRPSIDEGSTTIQVIDQAALERAIKRQRTLEELVSSEESYVADLKVLVNVYFTILASASASSNRNLTQIHLNINEILMLHEELLTRIRRVLLQSKERSSLPDPSLISRPKHKRWHSMDVPAIHTKKTFVIDVRHSLEVPNLRLSHDTHLMSEPHEAAEIASIFDELMGRFFIYEEYGARYESMLCDMTLTSKTIPNWHAYERGIEALANTLAPISSRDSTSKKGLTFGDLLIKPIQRVCKYPLLFADLYRHTPVIDCPESHVDIEKTLFRLRETATEINKATNDEYTRDRIQRSWHLQDLLVFQDSTVAPFTLRSLGHSTLCGVLHVAYQIKYSVHGGYMLCALFNTCLILGIPEDDDQHYKIIASISLSDLRIETVDNGKGLQCHTALFSWKVVFESDQQLFELIFSACSPREEEVWKQELIRLSAKQSQTQFCDDYPISSAEYSLLALDLKSIGSVLGQPGTLARRISIQRAATVGPRTNVCQVFIKNTHALRDSIDSSTAGNLAISRSQSVLSTNRIPILAPKRVDRMRMEHDLAKVWSKEMIPYPGMGGNRGEHLIRASASSMMRKLSRASIASGFTKRSASFTSLTNSRYGEAQESAKATTSPEKAAELIILPDHIAASDTMPEGKCKESLRKIIPPERTSSRNGTRGRGILHRRAKYSVSSTVLPLTDEHSNGPGRTLKNRWSSPISLISRTLSTEGMKNRFG